MGIEKTIVNVATAPARMWLAGVGTGLNIANSAVGVAKRALGDPAGGSGSFGISSMLGIDDDALARATGWPGCWTTTCRWDGPSRRTGRWTCLLYTSDAADE